MILRNRVIWSDNGTLKDISENMNNHISGDQVIPIVAAEDYIFLGSDAPFNHRWIEIETVNDTASRISIDIWDGDEWQAAVEVIDQTLNSAGDTTLARSGRLIWVPDKYEPGWLRDDTTNESGSDTITGLGNVTIYDMYWARLSFSADVNVLTELSFLGYKFANDEDLISIYPEFGTSEALARFKDGITNFDQVHFEAAKEVLRNMKATQIIRSENQVLEWEILRTPAIHKAAELIYSAYGTDWLEERTLAITRFKDAMKVKSFYTDQNFDATLSPVELNLRVNRMER